MNHLYNLTYLLIKNPTVVLTMLQYGAKYYKWTRWKILYDLARSHNNILEIGGGLSTLLLSSICKEVYVIEGSEYWKNFILSKTRCNNVHFISNFDSSKFDLIFIDAQLTDNLKDQIKASKGTILVDNRESLCRELNIPFDSKHKVGIKK